MKFISWKFNSIIFSLQPWGLNEINLNWVGRGKWYWTEWFLSPRWNVFSAQYELKLYAQFTVVSGISLRRPGIDLRPGMWDKWWIMWHWNRFPPSTSVSPHSIILPLLHTRFIYMVLVQGQKGEAWDPSKNNAFSKIVGHWTDTYFQLFPVFKGW